MSCKWCCISLVFFCSRRKKLMNDIFPINCVSNLNYSNSELCNWHLWPDFIEYPPIIFEVGSNVWLSNSNFICPYGMRVLPKWPWSVLLKVALKLMKPKIATGRSPSFLGWWYIKFCSTMKWLCINPTFLDFLLSEEKNTSDIFLDH